VSDALTDMPAPPAPKTPLTADQALMGQTFPPQAQLLLYSEDSWEDFVQEWAHYCLKIKYIKVKRFTGAGDKGIDIAGFCDNAGLKGVWDNYQCKHYDNALAPSNVWKEFGKVIWYSFCGDFAPPRKYYFCAPKGIGTKLSALLSDADKLKREIKNNWDDYCKCGIKKGDIELEGDFLAYFDKFDFSIFDVKTGIELVEDHKSTPHFAARFGGGLPNRPAPNTPPAEFAAEESRYIEQLLQAYADRTGKSIANVTALDEWPNLRRHFLRQRVAFFHAESLRVFARASVPEGTFESLQDEIFNGIIDLCEADHIDGYARVCAVMQTARELQITSNALLTRAKLQDRDGICHQLANEDRLLWILS
jgi:hypothetical protein